jgi:hypothetical protein
MIARGSLALLLVLAASCAKPATTAGGSTSASPTVRKDPNVITRAELEDPTIAATDAMTAIRQLRPAFFRTRGPQSFSNQTAGLVQVSRDWGPLRPLDELNQVEVRTLQEVRYLYAVEAQTRFGITANGGPVIVVLTSRQ